MKRTRITITLIAAVAIGVVIGLVASDRSVEAQPQAGSTAFQNLFRGTPSGLPRCPRCWIEKDDVACAPQGREANMARLRPIGSC